MGNSTDFGTNPGAAIPHIEPKRRSARPSDNSQWRVKMTALVLTAYRRISSTDMETLTPLLALCGAGLFVSLLVMSYGLDLSYGFF
jgi:hypothetical protein